MLVSSADRGPWVAEDVALALGVTIPEALETLHAVARLRYLEPVQASFTFSSTTGLIFRRVMAEPSQGA